MMWAERTGWYDLDGTHRAYGGLTPYGTHGAKDYANCASFPGHPKPPLKDLGHTVRGALAYPARRTIDGCKLTAREYAFAQMASCKTRVVFWLYYKFKWPARDIAEAFGNSIVDQHSVYMINRTVKRLLFDIETADKTIDWALVREMIEEGSTEQEIVEFYKISLATLRKNLRD